MGDGDRSRGISFIGDSCLGIESPGFADDFPIPLLPTVCPALGDLCERFVSTPKNRDGSFSFVGEGSVGGPISDVDLALSFASLRNVGDRGLGLRDGVAGREGDGRGEPVRE